MTTISGDVDLSYSVLMPVYQGDSGPNLDRAIHSMECQTVPFVDMVLIVDGPINEDIEEIITKWSKLLGARLTVHRISENVGLARALNVGIPLCRSEYIARMDADDVSKKERCELQLNKIAETGFDVVGGHIAEFNTTPGDLISVRRVPLTHAEILKFAAWRNPFNHMTVMYRKSVVLSLGGYSDVRLMEDYDLWFRMLSANYRCGNINQVLVDVRIGNGMYSRRRSISYSLEQVRFFWRLYRTGHVSMGRAFGAIMVRGTSALLPIPVLASIYRYFLRR